MPPLRRYVDAKGEGEAMSEKLCVFCKNLDLDASYESGYYEGDCYPYAELQCLKNHWCISVGSGGAGVRFSHKNLAEAIRKARTCKDYDEAKP